MEYFPYRQIHLDFHTSESVPGVGSDFNPEEFAATLKEADVDSITCFARCHHGWLYYDSKLYPELVHPNLTNRNLLEQQIEACHNEGIRVPVYTTVQWDGRVSRRHPEFCVISPDGAIDGYKPHEAGFYAYLCVNTPYRDFLKKHLEEVLTGVEADGIFLDIIQERDCSCSYCRDGMTERGLDPGRKEDRMQYAHMMIREFKADISAFIRGISPDCTVFFNGSHVGPGIRDSLASYSHLEVESLPSGGWGYTHFPLVSRFARGLGMDFCGMTGKFHTYWGDFHSFKNKAALEYECFNMLSLGGGCSVGDQLLPSGRLEKPAYELIGSVYSSVKSKESWCRGAESLAEIGVFNVEEWADEELPSPMIGALRILEEIGAQFDIIDSRSDFSRYKLLLLPDEVPVDEFLAAKLEDYLTTGGKIIASFRSGLTPSGKDFALPAFGLEKLNDDVLDGRGDSPAGRFYFTNDYCDFIRPSGRLCEGLPATEHSMYIRGLKVKPGTEAAEVLEETLEPWFYRTAERFCSHQQTPSSGRSGGPAAVLNGSILYFSHPVFTIYRKKGPRWVKKMVENSISMLIEPRLSHNGPSTLKVTVNRQKRENRWVIHLLHYIPEKRSEQIEIIEEVIPLFGLCISLLCEDEPRGIKTVPEGNEIDFIKKDGRYEFTVPEINGHRMIEVGF